MPRPRDVISELHVADLTTFLAVRRAGSVSTAARELGVTPSQVSKAIARLEATLRVRLFSRGARGVAADSGPARRRTGVRAAEEFHLDRPAGAGENPLPRAL